jgi:beta-lactam-binding protein with PASTA domain
VRPPPGRVPPGPPPPGPGGPKPKRRRLTTYVAAAVLAFFALMAVGATIASQAVELGIVPAPATATPQPTATPPPTSTPTVTPSPTITPTPTATPIPTVAVPALAGDTQRRAEEKLQQAGLTLGEVAQAYNDRVPAGNVISQEPETNENIEVGKPVKLTVSLGPQRVAVPDVIAKDGNAAAAQISGAGLTPRRVEEFNSQVQAGIVYNQQPRGQTQANRGAEVTIWVSKGREQITVPLVRGKYEADARKILEDAGLRVDVRYEAYSQADTGQVFGVVPPEGSAVDKGVVVTLRIRLDPTATPRPQGGGGGQPAPGPEATPTRAPGPGNGNGNGGQSPPGRAGRE